MFKLLKKIFSNTCIKQSKDQSRASCNEIENDAIISSNNQQLSNQAIDKAKMLNKQIFDTIYRTEKTVETIEDDHNIIDASHVASLIDGLKEARYRIPISIYIPTVEKSFQGCPKDVEDVIKPLASKWNEVINGNKSIDDELYNDFINDLIEISMNHPKLNMNGLDLYACYNDNIFKLYELEKRCIKCLNIIKSKYQVYLDTNFVSLDPYEFEEFIAKLFDLRGYAVELTKKTGDYGIDIIARNTFESVAIQTKKYSIENKVGSIDIQKLIGAMHYKGYNVDRAILITTSDFTHNAIEQARGNSVELWNKEILHQVIYDYMIKP